MPDEREPIKHAHKDTWTAYQMKRGRKDEELNKDTMIHEYTEDSALGIKAELETPGSPVYEKFADFVEGEFKKKYGSTPLEALDALTKVSRELEEARGEANGLRKTMELKEQGLSEGREKLSRGFERLQKERAELEAARADIDSVLDIYEKAGIELEDYSSELATIRARKAELERLAGNSAIAPHNGSSLAVPAPSPLQELADALDRKTKPIALPPVPPESEEKKQ